jgi:[protein-PII] uridylyltransferase
MQATAPDVWTPWRAALVNDLVQRIGSAFDSGAATTESLSAAERTRAEALAEAGRVGAPRSVLAFVEEAPIRYLTKRTPADVISDARLASRLSGPTPDAAFALGVRPGPAPETWAVDVLMRRRPDRVAVVAGVLTLSGCDVLAAEASFGPGSVTVDRFIVTSATHAPIEHDTWAAVERTLAAALSGRLDIETRLAERAKHYDTPGRRSSAHVSIPATSPFGFTVRVVAADRVGLLHDVARALAAQGLEIRRATVLTASGVADDTFEVTYAGIPGAETSPDSIVPLIEAAALGAPLGDGHRSQS